MNCHNKLLCEIVLKHAYEVESASHIWKIGTKITSFGSEMKRTFAISLLFIFLAGQVNLTWATHFCGSFAVDSEMYFGIEKLSCGIEEDICCDENEINELSQPIITGEQCCSNDYYSSDSDEYFINNETVKDKQFTFIAAYTITLINHHIYYNNKNVFHSDYTSKLISPDRQAMYQTYLL